MEEPIKLALALLHDPLPVLLLGPDGSVVLKLVLKTLVCQFV